MNPVELNWTKLNWVEPSWTELNQVEPSWTKLNQVESSWIKLNQVEQLLKILSFGFTKKFCEFNIFQGLFLRENNPKSWVTILW